jgi:hypothetical protein
LRPLFDVASDIEWQQLELPFGLPVPVVNSIVLAVD